MANLQTWTDPNLHGYYDQSGRDPVFVPGDMRTYSSGGGRAGSKTYRVPIGRGSYAEGLMLRVRVPDFFERISRRRAGWAHPWTEIERVLERANRQMAYELQFLVIQALDEGRVASRRDVSTGRLEAALGDPRNVRITGRAFAVGNAAFLSRSVAKYWRQIDQGTTIHVGRDVGWGFWMSAGGQVYSNSDSRRGDRWMSLRSTGSRGRRGSRIVGEDGKSPARRLYINRPIQPQRYFERAWKQFNPRSKALDALRMAIQEVLGIPMAGVPRTWNATVATMT